MYKSRFLREPRVSPTGIYFASRTLKGKVNRGRVGKEEKLELGWAKRKKSPSTQNFLLRLYGLREHSATQM